MPLQRDYTPEERQFFSRMADYLRARQAPASPDLTPVEGTSEPMYLPDPGWEGRAPFPPDAGYYGQHRVMDADVRGRPIQIQMGRYGGGPNISPAFDAASAERFASARQFMSVVEALMGNGEPAEPRALTLQPPFFGGQNVTPMSPGNVPGPRRMMP